MAATISNTPRTAGQSYELHENFAKRSNIYANCKVTNRIRKKLHVSVLTI